MERLAFTGGSTAVLSSSAGDFPSDTGGRNTGEATWERRDVLAYRGLLAFTFVLFVRPQDSIPILDTLHLGDLTAAFALITLAAGRLNRGAPVLLLTRELGWIIAFGGVMLLTAPFSVWPGGAVGVFLDLYSKVIVVFALMVNTVTTRARFRRLVTVVVVGTSYIAIRAVIDYARGINLVEGGRITGAVGGLFSNPNELALNMVAFLPLAIAMMLDHVERPAFRIAALLGAPAMAAAIIFSKSRGGTLGLIGMLLVLLYQMRRIRPGVAAVVVVACLAAMPMLPSSFTGRMATIFSSEQDPTGSREARKQVLRESYQAFLSNPLFGLGAGQFVNYDPGGRQEAWRETHNAVLQVAAELGVLGLAVFVTILGIGFRAAQGTASALRQANRSRRARAQRLSRGSPPALYAAALLASLTGWLLAAIFGSVAYYWTLYIVLGLAVTHRDITKRELQLPDGPKRKQPTFQAA